MKILLCCLLVTALVSSAQAGGKQQVVEIPFDFYRNENNITVGGISVDAPAVIFFAKGTGRDKKPWGINIGNAFLKDFVLTIDYRNKLVALERP